jgi:nicotinamide-nucleotide amidase
LCWPVRSCNTGLLYDYNYMINLSSKILKILTKKKLTLSFAESCTGGLLASSITSLSGSSKVFNMGLVTYSNNAKIKLLKVPKKTITKYGAVSYETCLSMVKNLSKISKSNISISITGVAGPNGGTKEKPVGLVYIGLKKGSKTIIKKNLFKSKNRISIQKATVNQALKMILKIL